MIQVVNEPFDSVVRILSELQFKALKKDLTGIYDAANEIMELFKPKEVNKRRKQG